MNTTVVLHHSIGDSFMKTTTAYPETDYWQSNIFLLNPQCKHFYIVNYKTSQSYINRLQLNINTC